jgi:hypothetical protein
MRSSEVVAINLIPVRPRAVRTLFGTPITREHGR